MKVVILAGGLGTRISEYTKTIPKPMIQIKGKPLIYYIMKHYAKYGYKEFIIEVSFITVQTSIIKTLNKIFKDCNIEVKKIISHQYLSRFAEKSDVSPCIAGKGVIDGINPSEVMMHNLFTRKQGLFEKMFNFFS